jgi:hypothetical protein
LRDAGNRGRLPITSQSGVLAVVRRALPLARRGGPLRLVTRRGAGPRHPDTELAAAGASNAGRLTGLAKGATAVCGAGAAHPLAPAAIAFNGKSFRIP